MCHTGRNRLPPFPLPRPPNCYWLAWPKPANGPDDRPLCKISSAMHSVNASSLATVLIGLLLLLGLWTTGSCGQDSCSCEVQTSCGEPCPYMTSFLDCLQQSPPCLFNPISLAAHTFPTRHQTLATRRSRATSVAVSHR